MDRFEIFNSRIMLFPKTDIPENCLLATEFFHPPPLSQLPLTHFTIDRCNFFSAAVFPLTKTIKKKKMGAPSKEAVEECFTSKEQFQEQSTESVNKY